MELRVLGLNEDPSHPLFQSESAQQLLSIYGEYYPLKGFELPWVAYLIVEDETVLGTVSFTEKPIDGKVEIAYWTFTEYQGRGVASFACSSILKIAKHFNAEIKITAKTAPENNASTHILEKNEFVKVAVVQDDEIGDAWLWEHRSNS